MRALIKEYGLITTLRATEYIDGLMAESTMELGRIVSFMERDSINGLMDVFTTVSTLMTKSKVLGFTSGQMGDSMRATGMMESSMERASSRIQKASASKAFGKVGSA